MNGQTCAQAAARLCDLANGLRVSQALYVAAELRIADHLADLPRRVGELAALTRTDAAMLNRVMRTLCALDIFSEDAAGQFRLTRAGALLRSDVANSFRAAILFMAGPVRWRCWSELLATVASGVSQSERTLGSPLFEFYAAHPAESTIHDEAMRSLSITNAAALVDAIDLGNARVVVDIGGGTGDLLARILARHARLEGVLFELPGVAAHGMAVFSAMGVAERCTATAGSFFDRIPERGDLYILKQVVHDWDDERATAILRCCRRFMPSAARLLVIERILPRRTDADAAVEPFLADLEMAVMTQGGRERTEAEFRALLGEAGFTCLCTRRTSSSLCILEARSAR